MNRVYGERGNRETTLTHSVVHTMVSIQEFWESDDKMEYVPDEIPFYLSINSFLTGSQLDSEKSQRVFTNSKELKEINKNIKRTHFS